MNKLKKRWLFLGIAWGCVIFMSGWNVTRISNIQHRRQELEMMRIDRHYIEVNLPHINQVRTQKKRLVHEVESFGLGFLIVENELKQLSDTFHLSKTRIEVKSQPEVANTVPVHIWTNGKVPNLAAWLSAVEDAFPYLSVSDIEIIKDNVAQTGQLTAILTYRYNAPSLETGQRI